MKKYLLIGLIVFFGFGVGGFLFWRSRRPAEPAGLPEPVGKLIETPLEERPYVTLVPRADGRELKLTISGIKNSQTIEYELVYLSNGLSRGAIGTIDLKGEKGLVRDILLGTCSRNVCKYDENVTEGTLTLRFRGSEGVRKFISDFHLQRGDDILTSKDGQFEFEATLPAGTYFLTMSTVGLPALSAGQVLAGPYGIFTSGSSAVKNAVVSLTVPEENTSAKLYTWDGKDWKDLKADSDSQTLSATISTLATFIAAE
jgi:hypothetical protein